MITGEKSLKVNKEQLRKRMILMDQKCDEKVYLEREVYEILGED